ncbi:MAG: histidine phosphatase family protein [Chloroflexi bacterium]|nr:histidine phosphatase family protein [Chloroflexota bacterium]
MSTQDMNTIYLVRHGENPANLNSEFSYKLVDYSLTPKGRLQAQQTAEYFRDKNIHEIYASPLKRTRETAEIIAEALGLTVTIVEEFREVNVGALERQAPSIENWEFHDRIVAEWFFGRHEVTFPEGENYLTLLQRMRSGLCQVLQNKTGKNIIIVGHAGIFTIPLRDICPDVDIEEITQRSLHNCSITQLEVAMNEGKPLGKLKSWAYISHLSGEAAQFVRTSLAARTKE